MRGYEFDPKDKDGSLRDKFDCYCKEVNDDMTKEEIRRKVERETGKENIVTGKEGIPEIWTDDNKTHFL